MAITKIQMQNVTVFENLNLELSPGLNILIGENGMGKTHIMKMIYSTGMSLFRKKLCAYFCPMAPIFEGSFRAAITEIRQKLP